MARRGGVIKEPRNLLNMVADNFVETENAGVMNCAARAAVAGANRRANEIQEKAFGRKKKQISGRGPRQDRDHVPFAIPRSRITRLPKWTTSKWPASPR
ncbi:MAG: hypothetical protein R3D59_10265 [Paracoccaceae bacterium]